MAEILQARVEQKVDTEANWLANPIILLAGEQAFVLSADGLTPLNFKIGDGTKTFSELPYWINYASNIVVPTVTPGSTLPNPGAAGKLIFLAPGTYTQPGGGTLTAPAGQFSVGFWDGTAWSLTSIDLTKEWNKVGQLCGFQGAYTVDYNTTTKQLTVTTAASSLFVDSGSNYYQPIAAVTDIIDTRALPTKASGVNHIVLKLSDLKLYVCNYTQQTTVQNNGYVFLGSFLDGVGLTTTQVIQSSNIFGYFSVNGAQKLVNSTGASFDKLATITSQVDGYKINIDTVAHTVTWNFVVGNAFIVGNGQFYAKPANGQTEAIQTTGAYTGINYIYYQISTAKIRVFNFSSQATAQNNDYLLLGTFYDLNSNTYKQTNTLVKYIFFDNVVINNFPSTIAPAVPTGEIVAPPKIWMLTGQKLPIYKTALLRNLLEQGDEIIMANFSTSVTDFNYPTFDRIGNEGLLLDPAVLKSTVRIYSKSQAVTTADYGNNVSINVVSPTAKTGLSKKWFPFGDSLTNRNLANYTLAYLSSISSGLTLTTYGTITNGGGRLGEGREGWTFLNFIGADNTHLGDNVTITRLADGATTSTLYENPFLRLATSTDTTAHPTWCFRNTGSNAELSYQSDPVKTGNFYIFDVQYYVTQHIPGAVVPDMITIALSTNDITENGAAGVTNSLFGAEVMLTQIKAAFPSVKVGVIPAAGQGDNSPNWSNICDWINQLNLKLTALALTGVEIAGVWIHMNKNFMFPYASNSNLRSDGNKTQVYVKNEFIHFGQDGYLPYAKALGAYIINNI